MMPGSQQLMKLRGTRNTIPASYYYGIWLKHLVIAWNSGYRRIPARVVEFGPGDCFGVGIAALLSGADEYYGLDVLSYSDSQTNLQIFRDMVELFQKRAPRPTKGWPDFDQYMGKALFPDHILSEEVLEKSLQKDRLQKIELAIKKSGDSSEEIKIKYIVPWVNNEELEDDSIDFCYSHSVLEYVPNLEFLFDKIHRFLVPNGVMSHQIDLSAHNLSHVWNGHRGFSNFSWNILKGKRPYFLTRNPYSVYKRGIEKMPFEIMTNLRQERTDGLKREKVSSLWKDLSDEDLNTSGAFIQARKVINP